MLSVLSPTAAGMAQVIREGMAQSRGQSAREVQEALRCLTLLTIVYNKSTYHTLGLSSSSVISPRLQALLDMASREGGAAIQVGCRGWFRCHVSRSILFLAGREARAQHEIGSSYAFPRVTVCGK